MWDPQQMETDLFSVSAFKTCGLSRCDYLAASVMTDNVVQASGCIELLYEVKLFGSMLNQQRAKHYTDEMQNGSLSHLMAGWYQ